MAVKRLQLEDASGTVALEDVLGSLLLEDSGDPELGGGGLGARELLDLLRQRHASEAWRTSDRNRNILAIILAISGEDG